MSESRAPFDHRPDPELGVALRSALEPGDQAAFVARVLALAGEARASSWDGVLARWARVGVAAALLIAAAAGYFVGRATAPALWPSVAEALIAPQAPEEVVLASYLGN